MEEPDHDLKVDSVARADPPDFDVLTPPEELVGGDRTRDDFFDAVLQLDEPGTIDEVATLASHGSDAAREYLDWFDRMGIVDKVSDSPITYRLNREYLTWRRVQRLRQQCETEELLARLETETERDRAFAEEFGEETPERVSLSDRARATDASVETVWTRLAEWRTTRRRIELLERALSTDGDSSMGHQRRVA